MRYLYWLQVMAVAVYTHILTKYAVIGDEHTHRRGLSDGWRSHL